MASRCSTSCGKTHKARLACWWRTASPAPRQLMLGYGYTLAHAGYAALLWDFGGHGANGGRLERDGLRPRRCGLRGAGQAAGGGREPAGAGRPLDGLGAAMAAGIRAVERYRAVVAIYPTGADVTAAGAPDLQLRWAMGGPLRRQRGAPSMRPEVRTPSSRRAACASSRVIPKVHISILFRGESHRAVARLVGPGLRPTPDLLR